MAQGNSHRGPYMMVVLTGLAILAVATPMTVAMLVTEAPRGFIFWMLTMFLCFAELAIYGLAMGALAAKAGKPRTSGASAILLWMIVAAYLAVGLVTILIYWAVRDSENPPDKVFAAIFGAITVAFFILAGLVRTWDLYFQGMERPVMERRAEHARKARSLAPLMARIRALPLEGDDRVLADRMVKRLETAETALKHSHGGGLGSHEGGAQHVVDPAAEADMDARIDDLDGVVAQLESGGVDADGLAKLESVARSVEALVTALDLG